ncbi:MAG: hypothetical protein R2712_02450 [Vicinamibacterales bacterium]
MRRTSAAAPAVFVVRTTYAGSGHVPAGGQNTVGGVRLTQAVFGHVAHDADDAIGGAALLGHAQATADQLLAWREAFAEAAVDERREGRSRIVGERRAPRPCHQRRADGRG